MPIQKIVQRALHSSETLGNRIIFFLAGLFLSAIFFLLMLKSLGSWGIYIALGASFTLNYWLKKNRRAKIYLNSLNNGLLTFNVFTVIVLILIMVVFYGAAQNLLN